MRFGLTSRILLAGTIVLAFLVIVFVLMLSSFAATRHATSREEAARESASLALTVEKLVLDLQTGQRGYVITHNERFLAPWKQARRDLPSVSAQLVTDNKSNEALAIAQGWRDYLGTWSLPLVALARTDPKAAQKQVEKGGGNAFVGRLRTQIESFVTSQLTAADADRQEIARSERLGMWTAATGIGVTALLFLLIVGYFLRAAIVPVRRIADATELVAQGELDILVPEEGAGEVGQLAAAFNTMARSLARQQSSLAEQNLDLERLANVLRAVLDSTVDGILLSDADGNVQLANRPLVEMTREIGMSFDGTVFDRLLSVAPRMKDPEQFRVAMEKLRASPDERTFNEFEDAETGRVFQGWTNVVRDDHGQFLGRIWTLREVTQQRELDRMKDEFVATVSHELRTPLTSMMGFLQMIREGEAGALTPEQDRFLAIVYRSSERLQRLVGDLLFVARLDATGLQLQFDHVQVDTLLREAVESASGLARSRDLLLEPHIVRVPSVWADRERLSQLFGNLISNALKFTPSGGKVDVRLFAQDGHVVAEVQDTGIGIPTVDQDRLFQRFFRSTNATAQAIPGTGLGLVISKAIAEAHGGTITVRSSQGQGACFRVELPVEQEE